MQFRRRCVGYVYPSTGIYSGDMSSCMSRPVPRANWIKIERVERSYNLTTIYVVGPLVESHHGNKLILVLVDQFTEWFECYAVPDQTAEVMCKELVNQFITRFGLPQQIHSDQGRNFESGLFQQLCRTLDITKTKMRTTPYRPSANGQNSPSCCPLLHRW